MKRSLSIGVPYATLHPSPRGSGETSTPGILQRFSEGDRRGGTYNVVLLCAGFHSTGETEFPGVFVEVGDPFVGDGEGELAGLGHGGKRESRAI